MAAMAAMAARPAAAPVDSGARGQALAPTVPTAGHRRKTGPLGAAAVGGREVEAEARLAAEAELEAPAQRDHLAF
jgi:hypothetical protein